MGFTIENLPTISVDELVQAQKEYSFFFELKESINRKKKKTPGNGFALLKCEERMKPLELLFDAIDQEKVLIV